LPGDESSLLLCLHRSLPGDESSLLLCLHLSLTGDESSLLLCLHRSLPSDESSLLLCLHRPLPGDGSSLPCSRPYRLETTPQLTSCSSDCRLVLVSGYHLEPMTRFLFSVWQLRISCCGAPSLTRGWHCNILVQLLLGLARVVTLGFKSRKTYDHMLLSFETPPTWRARSPYLRIPQEQGGPDIPLGSLSVAS
jgi:hypothetical protein